LPIGVRLFHSCDGPLAQSAAGRLGCRYRWQADRVRGGHVLAWGDSHVDFLDLPGGDSIRSFAHPPELALFGIVLLLYLFCLAEELMKQFILSLEIGKNYDRIMKGVWIANIVIAICMLALFLPGIFNR
jgi:hypothetical protein